MAEYRKFVRHRLKIILIVLVAYILYLEWLIYLIHPLWNWPSLPYPNPESVRILLAGDPQLLGNYHTKLGWIERWDADRFIQKTFTLASSYFKPDIVIFMGDIFDEGEEASDKDFLLYLRRFLNIFKVVNFQKAIIIPGDNDIGGEESAPSEELLSRFDRYFRNDSLTTYKHVDFVKVNYISLSYSYRSVLNVSQADVRVVLSHVPLTFAYRSFVKTVIEEIKPNLVFSAHDHMSQYAVTKDSVGVIEYLNRNFVFNLVAAKLKLSDGKIHEIAVPTCSYRMGTFNTGYGAAVIDPDGLVTYGVLWSPVRLLHLYSYCIVIALFFVLLLPVLLLR